MKTNQKGFSVVELLIILVVVGLIGGVGWYVWQSRHKTEKPVTQSTTQTPAKTETVKQVGQVISTADKKVQVTLPDAWHVRAGSSNADGKQIISVNTDTHLCDKYNPSDCNHTAPCLDVDDTVACTYVAEFQPKALDPQKDQVWGLTVEKTDWSIAKATESLIGELNASNTVATNSNKINGYEASYAKVKGGDCSAECYVDVHYFVKDSGYLLHFYNREQYVNHSVNPVNQDYSAYTADFAKIVQSLKLNF